MSTDFLRQIIRLSLRLFKLIKRNSGHWQVGQCQILPLGLRPLKSTRRKLDLIAVFLHRGIWKPLSSSSSGKGRRCSLMPTRLSALTRLRWDQYLVWQHGEIVWYGCVQDIFQHVLVNLEDFTNLLLEAAYLEEVFHLIKSINNLGDFYAYQIVCDMVEIGLLRFRCESLKPPLIFTPSYLGNP